MRADAKVYEPPVLNAIPVQRVEAEPAPAAARKPQPYTRTRCAACGDEHLHYAFSVKDHRLVRCANCATMMLNPQPTDEALAAIYGEDYALLADSERGLRHAAELKRRTARHYLDLIGEYRGGHGGTLLEIGCGQGDLLAEAASLGYHVTGADVSPYACRVAQSAIGASGRVICGGLDAIEGNGAFDVVVLADVIEHVREPARMLERLHQLLKPGGTLFIATPALDSWSARWLRHRWMEFKLEHLTYFNRQSLQTLLLDQGFGQLTVASNHKYLSAAYIHAHFDRYRTAGISALVRLGTRLLPESLRWRPLKVVASGMIAIATKADRRPRKRLSIVVAAYNEAATLAPMLDRLVEKSFAGMETEIILVESNSTDGTRLIAQHYALAGHVKLVQEEKPRGKGHAIRTGFEHATGDVILIQDADLEYDVEDYEALLQPILSGQKAFVLGARHGGATWKLRQFENQPVASTVLNIGHWIFTAVVDVLFGLTLRDPMTMYKVFRRDCLHGLSFACNRFDFDFELLVKLVRKGYRPLEIPVNYRSRSFRSGKKVDPLRDPLTWIWALLKLRFTRLQVRAAAAAPVPAD